MNNFVKETKTGVFPSLFQCAPSKVLNNLCCTCLPIVIACALRWTLGNPPLIVRVPYSSCVLTRELNAVSLTFVIFVLILRRTKPSVRFAMPAIHSTCLRKGSQRYQSQDTLHLWQTLRPGHAADAVCNLFLQVSWIPSHAQPGTSRGWTQMIPSSLPCQYFEVLNCHPHFGDILHF